MSNVDHVSVNARPGGAEESSGAIFHFFSDLLKRAVRTEGERKPVGKVSDLVFRLADPFPEAVGIYMRFGWGRKPPQFVPWELVLRIEPDAIIVKPPTGDGDFPPFVDQMGWIMLEQHLMGRTILEIDGRKTQVVNDVHLLEAKGKLLLVHVDGSLNGILRRWGFRRMASQPDDLISWKFVQPFSVEDAVATDEVMLSVTRDEVKEMPGEDLADALEQLSGEEQNALFSALGSEKAAETLIEAEPRAQRQLIAHLRKERARGIFSEMSVVQIADIFSILPHDHQEEFLGVLPPDKATRVRAILSNREVRAGALMSADFLALPRKTTVGETLSVIRSTRREARGVAYLYVLESDGKTLAGVVNLWQVVLESDEVLLEDIMAAPVVTASPDDMRDDLAELFARYHFRMLPIVDADDRIVGVVRYEDIVK
jgi:magnesium transporter